MQGRRPASRSVLSLAEVRATVRKDFYSFLVRCFAELHGGRTLSPAWHAEVLAAKLQGVGEGQREAARRQRAAPAPEIARRLGRPAGLAPRPRPALAIVNVTYAQDLSDKFARDCRAIMTSDWYQALFATRLASPREPLPELATTRGGFRMATSVGGVLTGRGADVILIDDPLKPADAMSREPPRRGQRLVRFDALFAAQRQAEGRDRHRHAAAARGRSRRPRARAGRLGGRLVPGRSPRRTRRMRSRRRSGGRGRSGARPAKRSIRRASRFTTLERIRATIGEMNFAAQYQQRPAPAGGGMIKAAWLQRFRLADPPPFDRIVQSWDTANKPSELSDYSVCTTWGVKGPRFYLLNVLRKKLSYPELRRAVVEQDRLFRPQAIVIEDRASGTQLIQDLIDDGLSHVARFSPDGDKIMRLHAQTAVIENGFVFVPEEAPWLADYLAELTTFPAGRHDDQVDSTAQALAWARRRPSTTGMIDFWAGRADGLSPTSKMARVKAPEGVSHVQVMSGAHLVVPNDRILELDESDAKPLLTAPGWMRA